MNNVINDITVDYSRDALFDELGLKRLKESYMREEETSPQERFAYVSRQFGSNKEHAQRLYEYSSKHWLSYSTPILSFGRSARGLPISCFLPYLHDSSEGLVDCLAEVNWLSMLGGGVGIGLGIRSADDKSVGICLIYVHMMQAHLLTDKVVHVGVVTLLILIFLTLISLYSWK
jgi:ribonucleoside-diphosphate reductase alpha chain